MKSRLSAYKQYKLIEHFVAGATARSAGTLVNVNKNTGALYFQRLRELIAQHMEQEARDIFEGEIEVDESYFGGTQKGKRGGKVYTQVIPNTQSGTLMPIIHKKVVPDSIVYSDCWRAYNSLDTQGSRHFCINHSKLFADKKNHINGIENFWNQAKRHLRKFNGVPKEHFWLFLKECEWRFNNSHPKDQLSQLKQWVQGALI